MIGSLRGDAGADDDAVRFASSATVTVCAAPPRDASRPTAVIAATALGIATLDTLRFKSS